MAMRTEQHGNHFAKLNYRNLDDFFAMWNQPLGGVEAARVMTLMAAMLI
jgi:hypothetical protein